VLTAEAFLRSGKVRDLYELPDGRLLLVASDRISAFDVVLPTDIPDKGRVLTGLSRFWFAETDSIVPNHLLDVDVAIVRDAWQAAIAESDLQPTRPLEVADFESWRGRVMICQPAEVIPVEAVVRGFLAGSGWKGYEQTGHVCGIRLPTGLRESDRLPEPIFTPATKAEQGLHDENVSFEAMATVIGGPLAERVRAVALELYRYASAIAAKSGLLIADTKFEFGLRPGTDELLLIDEVLTPDSSRFWDMATYEPGRAQDS
jgi:phosphoribosylaminoimidazole-succinocarboxamide synthase